MVNVILSQLLCNTEYFSQVYPYLKDEYFDQGAPSLLFKAIKHHVEKYNGIPSKVALGIAIENMTSVSETQITDSRDLLKSLGEEKESKDWLVSETEKFVQQKAMYIATTKIIEIQANAELPPEKRNKHILDVGAIPDIMRDAVSISFDTYLGHDWMNDYEARWLSYQHKTRKIPFKLNILNKITKGGAEVATLNILLAGVNVGKSLGLCTLAADYLLTGKDVLYISMEMAEEVCAKRIDANLLDVSLDDIDEGNITYEEYKQKMEKFRSDKGMGRLKFKQYGNGSANANTFRALLNELKLKQNFVPDVIMIDYLGICASCRIKQYSENSYVMVKAIAEELRALAFETNTVIWTGAQTTRSSWDSSDMSMSDIAESAGLAATADFILGVLEIEELTEQGLQKCVQIKSRYGDKNINRSFDIGVKKGNQRWYEVDKDVSAATMEYYQNKKDSKPEKPEAQTQVNRATLDDLADDILQQINF